MNDLASIPEGMNILIDTNILLYTAFAHPYYHKACTDFLLRIENNEISGFIPSIVVQEVFHHFLINELIEKGYGDRPSECISMYKKTLQLSMTSQRRGSKFSASFG